jgi:Domain of unknown function (DUF222)/HNH endonuclease
MFDTRGSRSDQGVALIAAGIDALLEGDLAGVDDRELVRLLARLETQARRLPAVMHRVVAALDERRVARGRGLRDTASLLRRELKLSAGEARSRVEAAGALATGTDREGDPLRPELPRVASAQERGELSTAHARVIQQSLEELPVVLRAARADELEETLVAEARQLDPHRLAARARQLLVELDPDRVRREEDEHQRRRAGSFVRNPDGSSDLRAHLTPVGTAIFEAAVLPLTAPQPDDAGGRDEREPRQRFHDGLVEGCRRLLAAKDVPGEGGVPATVLAIVPLADLTAVAATTRTGTPRTGTVRTGTARTQYGGTLSIGELLKVAGEAMVVPVVVDDHGAPLHVGRARRFATRSQTYALIARDKGCTFPGCDHPPPWTQRHHIRSWLDGGPTDADNLTLLCPYHHANFATLGWACRLIDGAVHWVPPVWVDAAQVPIRNTSHDRPEARSTDPAGRRAA